MKKRYMRNIFNSFVALLLSFVVTAQTPAIGQWRDHLPYAEVVAVADGPDRVWAASAGGLFAYVKADNSIERLNKINGLSDISISTINLNTYNNKLVVAYKNGNVDIVYNKQITNVPDIKLSGLIGDKTIHSIFFINQFAYLATGFGIVVLDTDKMEIHDTYIIGASAAYVNVFDITSDGQNLYAATATCVYEASLSSSNLANFSNWHIMTGSASVTLPTGIYNTITTFSGKVFVNYSKQLTDGSWGKDTTYIYDPVATSWSRFTGANGQHYPLNCHSLRATSNYLLSTNDGNAFLWDQTYTTQPPINSFFNYTFNGNTNPLNANMGIKAQNGLDCWFADRSFGLVYAVNTYSCISYMPNGPKKTDCYAMTYSNGMISMVPGSHADNWGNMYNNSGISTFTAETWRTLNYLDYTILGRDYDFLSTAIDPNNANHIMYGSLGFGVFEFTNWGLNNIYNVHHANCTLQGRSATDTATDVGGMCYDANGNLWVTNMHTPYLLHCREASGRWTAFDCRSAISNVEIGAVIAGTNGVKWAILPRGRGILIYNDNATITNPSDDKVKHLQFTKGLGGIPGTDVFCLVEDKNQQVWIGTDAGIGVFYNPDNMFASTGYDAQQILIQQGVHVQILMEGQTVTTLAVDGANRKWIGTLGGGVFLMSADGTQQIANFNTSNSPILSNNINAITVNGITGEVFFGTDQGVISYRSTATEGDVAFNDVFAFPNPVRHEYTGPIAIKGLTTNADVKITDITGNLIFQTTALGGQAIWDGNNFKGERAHTGVYLVFCSDTDGKQTIITKILFIN
ncbi:MAG: two-component regulator propeller domain-containing protein [Bacteroidia bacterium]